MLLMCQLNREIEKRPPYVPKNSDLRESGQIEQDADLILFVQWPVKFDVTYKDESEYRIYITKRRSGAVKTPMILTTFTANRQQIGMFDVKSVGERMQKFAYDFDGNDGAQP
jgi:replicative DNA helicase